VKPIGCDWHRRAVWETRLSVAIHLGYSFDSRAPFIAYGKVRCRCISAAQYRMRYGAVPAKPLCSDQYKHTILWLILVLQRISVAKLASVYSRRAGLHGVSQCVRASAQQSLHGEPRPPANQTLLGDSGLVARCTVYRACCMLYVPTHSLAARCKSGRHALLFVERLWAADWTECTAPQAEAVLAVVVGTLWIHVSYS
jgi:hypothetical protein